MSEMVDQPIPYSLQSMSYNFFPIWSSNSINSECLVGSFHNYVLQLMPLLKLTRDKHTKSLIIHTRKLWIRIL